MNSQTIDSKVVEMKFDNQQFEANVKTSLSTLDKLKQSLRFDGAEKGFANIEKAASNVSFEAMALGIESLEKRFSTFGIVGMRIIENLTDSAMRFATKTLGTVTNQIITGGKNRAFNIENAHFQLQGLLGDEEKVQAIMADAMDSVDGTAYAYDEAAKAASQFAASGLESGEEMMKALRGITGVAAMTNSAYEDISRVFTTVAGNGRVMGDQLLQLSGRGLNAAATLTDFFNGVNNGSIEASESVTKAIKELSNSTSMTEGDIREFVSKGKVSFRIFSEAMDNAFGEHAKKANETFSGALSNVRAALSRIGAEFISPLVVQNGALVKFFNALRVQINEVKKNIGPLADLFTDTVIRTSEIATEYIEKLDFTKFFDNFNNGVETIHNALKIPERIINAKDLFDLGMTEKQASAFQKVLIETAKKHNIAIDEMIEKDGSFNATIKNGWLTGGILKEAYNKIEGLTEAEKQSVQNLDEIREAALKVIRGDYGNDMEAVFAKLAEDGFDAQTVQNYVNALHEAAGGTWNLTDAVFEAADAAMDNVESLVEMSDAELENAGYTQDEIQALRELKKQADETNTPLKDLIESFDKKPSGLELIISSIGNVFGSLGKIFKQIGKAWNNVFPASSSEMIYGLIEKIHGFTEGLKISGSTAHKIRKTFQGLFSVVSLVGKVFSSLGKAVMPVFGKVLKGIGGEILNASSKLGDWLTNLNKSVKSSELFENVMKPLGEKLRWVVDKVGVGWKQFKTWAKENQILQKSLDFVANGLTKFGSVFSKAFQNVKDGLKNTFKSNEFFMSFYNKLKKFKEDIKDAFADNGIAGVFSTFKDRVKQILGSNDFFKWFMVNLVSLKDGIKAAFSENGIAGVFGFVKEVIKNAFTNIFAYFTSGQVVTDLIGAFGKIKDGLSNFKDWIVEKLGLARDGVDGLKDSIVSFGEMIKEKLGDIDWSSIVNYLGMFATAIVAFKTIKGVIGIIKNLQVVSDLIDSFAAENKANAFETKTKAIRNIAISIGILASAMFVLGNMDRDKLKQGAIAIGGLMASFAILSVVLSKFGKMEIKAGGTILAFAVSLILIVSTLKRLQRMDLEGLDGALTILNVLMLSLVGVAWLIGKSNLQGSIGSAATLLAFAFSIKLLVGAFAKINRMDLTNADKSLFILGGMMATLALVAKVCNGIKMGSGVGLLAIVVGLNLMIGIMKKLAKLKISTIAKSLPGLIALIGMVGALMLATKLAGEHAAGGGAAIFMISVALNLMVFAVKALGKMDSTEASKGVMAMLGLMAGISLMMSATGAAGKNAIRAGIMIAIITGALTALAFVVKMLAGIDSDGLAVATLALSKLMVMMGLLLGFASSLKTMKNEKISIAPILALSVAVIALAGALYLLSRVKTDQLEGATAAMLKMMTAFGVLGLLSNKFANGLTILASLGAMALVVAALAGIFYLIRDLDAENMLTHSEALSRAIVSIGGVCAALSAVHADALSGLGAGLSFDAFILTVGGFGVLLGAINDLTGGGLVEAVEAGIPVLEAAGGLIGGFVHGIVEQFSNGEDESLSGVGSGLTSFMDSISSFLDTAEEKKDSFGVIGELASAILKITAAEVLDGIASWVTGGSNLSTFAEQLPILGQAMTDYADSLGESLLDEEKITASTNLANLMATLYGSNDLKAGGLIGDIVGNSIGLDKLGGQLVMLATGLSSYASLIDATTFNDDKIKASTNLAKLMATLYGFDDLKEGGIISWFAGRSIGLDVLGKQLPALAEGLASYANTIDLATFSQDKIKASTNLAQIMASLYGSEDLKEGGVISWFTGHSIGLDKLGGQLVMLANGLAEYVNTIDIATFNDDKIKASTNLAKLMATLYGLDDLKEGGLIGKIFTGSSIGLDTLGKQLVGLATGLKGYADTINETNFDADAIKKSKSFVEFFTTLTGENEILQTGGFLGWLTGGEINLSGFGNQLGDLAAGLTTYADNLGDSLLKDDVMTASTNLMDVLVALSTQLPETGGFSSNIVDFSSQLPMLGENLTGFADALGESVNGDTVTTSITAIQQLADLNTALSDNTGDNLKTFGKALKDFSGNFGKLMGQMDDAEQTTAASRMVSSLMDIVTAFDGLETENIDAYGKALTSIADWDWESLVSLDVEGLSSTIEGVSSVVKMINGMSTINTETIDNLTSAIDSISRIDTSGATSLASGITDGLAAGITSGSGTVTGAVSTFLTDIGNTISNKYALFQAKGHLLMTYFRKGIEAENLSSAIARSLSNAVSAIRNYYMSYYIAGEYLASGLARGIAANTSAVVAAATALGNAAANATRAAVKVQSPSKVFYEIGAYMGQGLANALDDYNDTAYNAGYGIADAARYGLSSAISKVSDLIENGMDTQPTIRPVLDLSDIEAGAGMVGSLLDLQPSYAIAGNLDTISAGMNYRNQNAVSNADVVSAIRGLQKTLGNVSRDTYNINGVTYDDGSNITNAVRALIRAARVERRV